MDEQNEGGSISGENSIEKNENNEFEDAKLSATPLRKYVTVYGEKKDPQKWVCNFGCRSEPYTGTYSRIRAHLIGLLPGQRSQGVALCSKVTSEDRDRMRREEEDAKRRSLERKRHQEESKRAAALRRAPLFGNPTAILQSQSTVLASTENGRGISDPYKASSKDEVDGSISRFFYSCGIPFSVAKSPFWVDMVNAIKEAPKGYEPPSAEKLKTSLLDKEKTKVDQALVSAKQKWPTYGVSVVSVGWANLKKDSFVKVMAVSEGNCMLIKGVNCSEDDFSSEFVADALLKAIESVGVYSVVQVITDDLYACRAAGRTIETTHPHIFWYACPAHTLSLLLKDIVKSKQPSLGFVTKCYSQAKGIADYIKNHSSSLHILRTFSELDVLQARKSRYGHHFVILERIFRVKNGLVNMVLSDDWDKIKNGKSKSRIDHEEVKKTVLDDNFWKMLNIILAFMKPIWDVLQFCDSDRACIAEIHHRMDDMLYSIKVALSDNVDLCKSVLKLHADRYGELDLPLHALARVLNPYYYSDKWLKSLAPGGERRKKPAADPYVQKVYLDALERFVRDCKEASIVRQQLGDFTSNRGQFSRSQARRDKETLPALSWWYLHGTGTSELYNLAAKVLSQCVTSASLDRGLTTCNYIRNMKRNSTNAGRAESLVYVHYNNRLLTRFRGDYDGSFKDWDNFIDDDNLEIDVQAIEGREYAVLHAGDGVPAQILPVSCATPLHSSQTSVHETSHSKIEGGRRKRPRDG